MAWLFAQLLKPIILCFFHKEKFDKYMLITTGGMPSSHTATVVALTTSVGLIYSFSSVYFAVCAVFSIIIIHDAMNLRMQAGKHAQVLNKWSRYFQNVFDDESFTEEHLKTMLGHSFAQVLGGFVLGLVIGFMGYYLAASI
ncbi:MAG: divergent PAP2 family protein [Spirochaetales bacterium]|nr:divergent PAP2 family protein [Spirochaetales bacterium]